MDCSLPGSSVHGILQARVLEWVANSFSPSRVIEAGEVSEATGGNQREAVRPVRADVLVPPVNSSCQVQAWDFPAVGGFLVIGDGHGFVGSSHCRGDGELGAAGRVMSKVHADTACRSRVPGETQWRLVSRFLVCVYFHCMCVADPL